MRITLLTSLAGHGWSLAAGDVHECSDAEATTLVAAGFAEPQRVEPIETTGVPDMQETTSIQTVVPKTLKPRGRAGGR